MIKSKPGVYLLYTLYFVVLTTASAAVSYQVLSYGEETRVPEFVGRSLADARVLASEKKLHVNVESSEYHADIPVGYVTRQMIVPGSDVKEGQIIAIVLSKGPVSALVPDFVGRPLEDARFLAVERGLQIKRLSYTHHETVKDGVVITQNPSPGDRGASVISLLISRGMPRKAQEIPRLVGLPHGEARRRAVRAGWKIRFSGLGPDIVSQSPGPGGRGFRGDRIQVTLGSVRPYEGPNDTEGRP